MTLHDLAQLPQLFWLILAAIVGAIFGSFVTALSYRLPRGENFVNARSKCPACGTVLQARDLVPVMSWLMTRGACRACGSAISMRYPLTELLMAGLFVSAVAQQPQLMPLALVLSVAVLSVTLAIIDLETKTLPFSLLILLALAVAALRWLGENQFWQAAVIAFGIAVAGVAVAATTRALRGSPLIGAGDAYLLAIGALAFPMPVYGFFLGFGALGALVMGLWWRWRFHEALFPFAPAGLAAMWLCLLYPKHMLALVG